jgi:tRNA G18 (ribose-2'-O)-methylase SpoU
VDASDSLAALVRDDRAAPWSPVVVRASSGRFTVTRSRVRQISEAAA